MAWWVQPAMALASNIFAKKRNAPEYQSAQMPSLPPIQMGGGDLNSLMSQMPGVYDPSQGQVYQQMLSQMQGGRLPQEYRNAVLGQAQQEAGAAYDQARSRLTRDRDRASRSAAEQMNKMGLLSSGALGVRQGYIDESFGEQLGGLASNYQSALGRASVGLMDKELDMRDRVTQLLSGMEQQRASSSLASRNALLSALGQERGLQGNLATAQGNLAANNAPNVYGAQKYAYEQQGGALKGITNNLMSLYGNWEADRERRRTLETERAERERAERAERAARRKR